MRTLTGYRFLGVDVVRGKCDLQLTCAYRTTEKICLCCAARRKGILSPVFLVRLQSQFYFSRQNSATLGGFFPLRGSDSAAHSALQIDFRLWLVALVWPVTASQSWGVRSALSLRAAYSGLVVLVCRAHLAHLGARQGRAGLQAQPPTEGESNKAVSNEEATLWATTAYLWLPAPGITYCSCFDYVDIGGPSHTQTARD